MNKSRSHCWQSCLVRTSPIKRLKYDFMMIRIWSQCSSCSLEAFFVLKTIIKRYNPPRGFADSLFPDLQLCRWRDERTRKYGVPTERRGRGTRAAIVILINNFYHIFTSRTREMEIVTSTWRRNDPASLTFHRKRKTRVGTSLFRPNSHLVPHQRNTQTSSKR